MSKSKIKKPFKPGKASKKTTQTTPNPQEKAAMTALLNEGRLAELEVLLQTWTVRFPEYVLGWQAFGALLSQLERSAAVLAPVRQKIVELLPDDAKAHLHLSNTLRDLGQLDDAMANYLLALKIKPDLIEAHCNLGITLRDLGQLDAAEASCRQALEINPDFAEAYNNLSVTLVDLGRRDEAEACCKRALQIQPDSAEAHNNLGYILHDLGRLDEAETSFRKALEINPNYAPAYSNLGCFLQSRGQLDDAVALFRQLLQIQPDNDIVHSSLIFDLDLMIGEDAASLQEERLRWDAVHAAHLHQQQTHANIPAPDRRLRVGYVSADFNDHSAARVFGGMLTCYDRSQFDVYAYSNLKGQNDQFTELFRRNVTVWRNIVGLSDDAVAMMILEDRIDILVDLSGHTRGNRLLVFARKPAPIQITAWGYATGTGMRAMDVFFTDPVMVPPEEQHYFTEQVRYLPSVVGSFFSEHFPDVNELPALSDGIITFGSFNRLAKMSDKTYRLWAKVLLAIPRSRLILKTAELNDAAVKAQILGHFTEAGVAADRIILQGKTSWQEHMQAYRQIDIALDPFPHGGGVTALEGLMMGVPVVTLCWPTTAGRLSASIMTTMKLPDWIAKTQEQYVELAVQKATDVQSLALLRRQLRGMFTSSVIGDQAAYARAVEQEYRQLWQEWCSSAEKPNSQQIDAPVAKLIEQSTKAQKVATAQPPEDAETHFQLGNDLLERGQPEAAVAHYHRALELKQDYAEIYCNLGNALSKLGQLDEATLNYQQALQIKPDNAVTLFNLGIILKITGRLDEAETSYRRALEIEPDFAEAHNNLAYTLRDMGRLDEAETSCRRALEINPNFAPAYYNLSIILYDLGRLDEAETSCRRALEIKPDFAETYCSLGSILHEQRRLDEAITCYQRALEIKPNYADVHSNLGVSLRDLGRLNEAEASCRRALEINPYSAGALSNLGATLRDLGQLNEAEASCRRALEINPNFAPAHYNLGVTINSLGWLNEAETHYRRALEIKPDFTDAHSNLIFTLDLMPDKDIASLQEERKQWDTVHAAHLHQQRTPANIPDPERRIRIGYVSADLHNHSATRVFGGMLIRYDRSQFDVFAYSNSKGQDDELTELFRQNVTAWRNIVGLSDDAIAKMIREDRIDILVDLSGHTAGNRLLVFARKPAPIQITAWGYATGTGMRAMDVFFTDPVMVPPEEQHYFTEQIRYLPSVVGSFFPEPFPDLNELPALSDGIITFGSFNRLAKVSDITYCAWAKVLLAVPRSRLILKTAELNDAKVRERVLGHFTQAGVAADRITLQGKTSWQEHMQAYRQIDIALDPFPHGGGVTALEGLMMGVPVITLRWPTMAGRLSASIMTTLGLPDWIAETQEHYVELAAQKATDVQSLALLRRQLRGMFTSSVIGDQAAYAQAVEQEYRQLWQEWCSSAEKPNPQQIDAPETKQIEQSTKAQKVAMTQPSEDAEMHFQLGNTLLERGQPDAAVAHYRWALELKQDYAEVHCNLGNALSKLGQLDEAMLNYRQALQIKPDNAVTLFNLGIILKEMGRLDEAESSYRQALEINPDFPEAHSNLAYTLKDMGRLDEAEAGYRRALQLKPDYAEAHYNLGLTLYNLGRLYEAEICYRQALQINPDYAEALNNLGNVLQDIEQIDAAQTSYRRALEIKPDFADAHSNLIFSLDLTATANLPELHSERKKWEEAHATPLWQDTIHANNCSPARRLRVGYVSADFRKHSAPKVFGGMLTGYDRSQFDVFAYSNSNSKSDEHTELFRQNVTVWRNIAGLSDDAVAKMITEDRIDILVDLSGHSAGNRLLVFARKPAPIQITAWGYATGTGMLAMDVFFTDPVMVPPEEQHYFTEQIRYLPSVVGAFFPEPFPDVNELPVLSDGIITFGSFNRLVKVSDETYNLWARVLLAIPRSRLILKTAELNDAKVRERVLGHFTQAGVAANRITLQGKTSWQEHMQAYRQIDIALDPFPHGGGVTALEGLMMGVPMITLRWPTMAGRLSASIMTTLGLPDWIAETQEHYVELAVQKAADVQSLALLRRQLRGMFTSSVIGDQAAYVQAVEQEYRQLWQEWCTRQGGERNALQEAEQLFHAILQNQPDQPDANYNLGMLLLQTGRRTLGLPHLKAALEADPSQGQYWLSYADALLASGQPMEALVVIQTALQNGLDTPEAHTLLQKAEAATQDDQTTDTSKKPAIEGIPESLEVSGPATQPKNQLVAMSNAENPMEMEKWHSSAENPSPQEINSLTALFTEGRYTEAEALAQTITIRFPLHGFGWKVLGASLQKQGKDAVFAFQEATKLSPNDAEAHYNLGVTFQNLGRLDEAAMSYRRALQITPDDAQVHCNLGATLHGLSRLDEAEASYRQALEIKPNYAEAHYNLGVTLRDLGRLNEAEQSFRRALKIKPGFIDAHSNLIFVLDLMPDKDTVSLQEERKQWDAAYAAHLYQQQAQANIPVPDRRMRIGYVSADFWEHSAAKIFGGMLTRYDRSQFDVFAYSNSNSKSDEHTELFRQNVTVWRNIAGLSDDAVAKMIREDRIDILVDLSGHSAGNRLLVFARKPAPIQITAWGYATGTGMRAMDVFFTDPVMVPPEEQHYFTEQIRYLPSVVGAFFPEPFPDLNELPALSDGIITFGSFNRLVKVSDETYNLWAKVLLAVPRSRLILKTAELNDAKVRERVLGHFTQAGVAADRITLQGKTSWQEHMQAYRQIDIALDPFPHGGGVTALEGLMMGVPMITLRWPTMAGRLSASIMTTLGLPDWIAKNQEHYIELVVQKATDVQSLALLRRQLRGMFTSSVIGDQAAYVLAVEQEYRQLWQEWCTRQGGERNALQEAEQLFHAILQNQPDQPDANYNLGMLLLQTGRHTAGLPHLRAALEADPSQGQYWLSYADALLASGQPMEALVVIQTALQNGLDTPEAHTLLEKAEAATQSKTQPVETSLPKTGEVITKKGKTAKKGKKHPKAAQTNQLIALFNAGNYVELENKACLLVERHPDSGFAWKTLGVSLKMQGKDGVFAFQEATKLSPNDAEAHYNLGVSLLDLGRLNGAEASYRRALQINSNDAQTHCNLGSVLQSLGQLDEAEQSFRQALKIKPDFAYSHSNLIFTLDLMPDKDTASLQEERKQWDAVHAAPLHQQQAHTNIPLPDRRLRVGYVSADFREHSATIVFGVMLTRYDRSQFDVFAYSSFKGRDDKFTELFRQNVTVWRNISDLSDDAVAKMIREDRIDILIDLSGHSANNRLLVFAHKPAPIQITAWGYATGTGMRAMDVFFTDPVMVPPEEQHYFTEQIRYLPSVVGAFFPEPFPDLNELPALSDGIITFGSFNRLAKVTDKAYRAWAKVLLAIPRSRLILKTAELNDAKVRERVLGHFTQAGVTADRITLQCKTSWQEHMQAYRQIDIALDPFPHGGGVTALEGLMMGVPMITLRWPTMAGRLSASIMTTLGLPDWIAETQEHYVELAVQKATDVQSLALLRRQLRGMFTSSVIGDQAAYVQAVEQEYRQLWQEWCTRQGGERNALQEAEQLFHAILQNQPDQPDANYNLGMLLLQTGRHTAGLPHLRAALEADPSQGQYWLSYADALLASGQPMEALVVIQTALQNGLDTPEAHTLLEKAEAATQSKTQPVETSLPKTGEVITKKGKTAKKGKKHPKAAQTNQLIALFNAGNYEELENKARLLVERHPDSGFAWKVLGASLQKQGKDKDAVFALQKTTKLLPDDAEAHYNLGVTFQNLGRLDEAAESYRRALQITPDDARVHCNLGLTLYGLNRLDEAETCFRRALTIKQDYAEAYNNLGNIFYTLGRPDEAEANFRRALTIKPDYAEAYNNLGNALRDLNRLDEAQASCQRALEIRPDFAEAYNNLGNTLLKLGQIDTAMEHYHQALAFKQDFAEAHNNLGNTLLELGQINDGEAGYRKALAIKPGFAAAHTNLIFALDLMLGEDIASLQEERKRWDATHAAPLHQQQAHANTPDPDRRMRIGYVSADFWKHSASKVFGNMLTCYDRSQFDVFAYSNSNSKSDELTELFRQNVTVWRDITGLSDDAVAMMIREDRIDILVDLSGHTAGNRLLVFARKPAPIQITAWGYATSTGMQAMDVFFTDPVIVPPEEQHYFTEQIRYLPNVVGSFFPEPFPDLNELPALSNGIITFGSFNRLVKVSDNTYCAWAEVLLAVPRSRLILKTAELNDAKVRERVLGHFTQAGVAANRITLQGKTSWQEHMQAYRQIDIALDPFPHGGGVTALEGLMMGVPMITLRWPTMAGRLSASIMTTLGLSDWIAETQEHYVELAIQKATDVQSLALLRRQLRGMFTSSVIGDHAAYTRAVEQEYRQLWQKWCASLSATNVATNIGGSSKNA